MPHKVTTMGLVDELSTTAEIAGACNAIRRCPDGSLRGDQFDGAGFVRGVQRKGLSLEGKRALVSGCGGVGSAIAASLAGAGVAELALFDTHTASCQALAARLRTHYRALQVSTGSNDPAGFDLVVNATPLGGPAAPGLDPVPSAARLGTATIVFDLVYRPRLTPLPLPRWHQQRGVLPAATRRDRSAPLLRA